jgi:hypothetical protein
MSKFMYMLCIKYVEMQAYEVYEMYNKIRIFLQCWLITTSYKLETDPALWGTPSAGRDQP